MVIKLHGIGNTKKFNYYIFYKKQKVAEKLAKISKKVFNLEWNFVDFDGKKEKKINIEKYKDKHLTLSNRNARIDIFYGDKRMFITVYCSLKLRAKLNDELEAVCIMPKPKVSGNFFKNKKKIKKRRKK